MHKNWDIETKWTNLRENHPKYLYIKYQSTKATGFQEKDENVIENDGQTTDVKKNVTKKQQLSSFISHNTSQNIWVCTYKFL